MKRPLIFACAAVLACACAFWLVAQRDRAPREAPPAPSSAASASSASAPALESDAPAAQHESAAAAPRAPSLAPEPVTGPSATLVVVCVDEHDGRALPDLGVRVQRSVAATDAHATQGAGPGFSGCISPRDDAGSRWEALTDEYAPPRSDSIGRVSVLVPAATSLRVGLATSNVYQRAVPLACPALAEGETRELRLPIRRANDTRFRGLVVDAGSGDPLALVRVSTSERSQSELVATTGNDGRFEMPATSWEVTHARLELDGFVALTIAVDVSGDEPGSEHRLQLVRGAVVCGHLLDEHGAPLQMSSIRLAGPAGFQARAFCEADGAFELDGLPPGVAFAVDLERWRRPDPGSRSPPPPGTGERRTLELRVAPGSAFEGVVVDENHQPVAGVSLWLVRAPRDGLRCGSRELRERAELSLTSDAQGRFACSGLQPGTWALALDAHYTLPSVPTIVNLPLAPGTSVEVLHFQSASIRGRVVDPEGKPVASASVSFALEGCAEKVWIRADADGSFFEGVHGPWTYRVQAGGEFSASSSDPVLARAGATSSCCASAAARGWRCACAVRRAPSCADAWSARSPPARPRRRGRHAATSTAATRRSSPRRKGASASSRRTRRGAEPRAGRDAARRGGRREPRAGDGGLVAHAHRVERLRLEPPGARALRRDPGRGARAAARLEPGVRAPRGPARARVPPRGQPPGLDAPHGHHARRRRVDDRARALIVRRARAAAWRTVGSGAFTSARRAASRARRPDRPAPRARAAARARRA